ncbi:Pre-mRNA-splicing factor [Rhodotorula sphaerocarpa]
MADSLAPAEPPKKRMVKRKPARKQAGGDKYDNMGVQEKSQTRVDIKKDAGYTRADGSGNKYICLFFARGCCPYGQECTYLHRLPPRAHVLPDASLDVFGREKHSQYRDDMGGVGSFSRQNRTLYIGRIKETRDTPEIVEEHFSEFGEIERIKVLTSRGVAFVTYVQELNAQFAKEAMMHQSLDNDEVLNVRWATEDPNPAAKRKEHARLLQEGEAGIQVSLDPEFVQRVRELDELEGKTAPRLEDGDESRALPAPEEEEDGEGEGRQSKRARIEPAPPPAATVEEEHARHNMTAAGAPPSHAAPAAAAAAGGILSGHAVDSLRVLAQLREKRLQEAQAAGVSVPTPKAAPAKAATGLGGLAAYGSDDESD